LSHLGLAGSAKNIDDQVILKNGDRFTGEIKGLQSGELKFKSTFMILLTNGKLVTAVMRLLPSNSTEVANL